MTGPVARTTSSEILKLYGLPAIRATVAGTAVVAAVLAAAQAAVLAGATGGAQASRSDAAGLAAGLVLVRTIPLLQVGTALVGVLAVATEYEGRQIVTTLSTTPARTRLLAGKTLAATVTLVATAFASCVAGMVAAAITLSGQTHAPATTSDGRRFAGAVAYLVLIGMLSVTVTVVLRTLVASLTTMLSYLLVVSPLAAGWTEHARWLPDQAGRLLYIADTDSVLTPGDGALVVLMWVAVAGSAATVAFARRDA